MSGGYFDTSTCYSLLEDIETVTDLIKNNKNETLDEYGERLYTEYSEETLNIFKILESLLRTTKIYLKHVDYLLAGDHSEKSMMKRISEDLKEMFEDPEIIENNDLIGAMNEYAIMIETKMKDINENS